MTEWRNSLFAVSVTLSTCGWALMAISVRPYVRPQLGLLAVVFAVLMGLVHYYYRERLTGNLVMANLALGMVVHTTFAALIVAADRLTTLGVLPALGHNWTHFTVGGIGIVAAFLSWTRAHTPPGEIRPTVQHEPEPAPPELPELATSPDWTALQQALTDDPPRMRAIQALQRTYTALGDSPNAARRVIRQEAMRLASESAATRKNAEDEDLLTQMAGLFEWGAQKLPELAELDVSDLMMGKAIADIRSRSTHVEKIFVDHRHLRAIHPIDRATADAKCNERADAARAALPILRAHSMRLSEDLIAAEPALEPFRSVTGFQVIPLDDGGYVTFEGNGRREALSRAFGDDEPVHVEVRCYRFDDPAVLAKMQTRVERVRRWKKVHD